MRLAHQIYNLDQKIADCINRVLWEQ